MAGKERFVTEMFQTLVGRHEPPRTAWEKLPYIARGRLYGLPLPTRQSKGTVHSSRDLIAEGHLKRLLPIGDRHVAVPRLGSRDKLQIGVGQLIERSSKGSGHVWRLALRGRPRSSMNDNCHQDV